MVGINNQPIRPEAQLIKQNKAHTNIHRDCEQIKQKEIQIGLNSLT